VVFCCLSSAGRVNCARYLGSDILVDGEVSERLMVPISKIGEV
jgi:hypothetical protein